jgi:predicted Zn-dependent protease
MVENLEKLLASGQDSPLLRFGLGNAYLAENRPEQALVHLRTAVTQDPGYSAGWKLLGRALAQLDRDLEARDAYRQGIAAADRKGDKQAAKEMTVFLRRLEKKTGQQDRQS